MDRAAFGMMWDQVRQKYGVYVRLLEAIPGDRFHDHPIAGMRTPAQLVAHVSGSIIRDIAQGVARGEITANEAGEDQVAAGLATKEDVLRFAGDCWKQADQAVAEIGDAELAAMVPTPWNMEFPGAVAFHVMNDEFVHHRGQLYAFCRALGGEPPFMWSYAENAVEYRPAEPA